MQSKLLETKIADYIKLLRDNSKPDLVFRIEEAIKKELGDVGGGVDVGLFLLSKDLLLLQCKMARAILDFDDAKAAIFEKKIKELKDEIKKKQAKTPETSPYQNFLKWILSLKKYFGSDIDKGETLYYLIEATKQMISSYEAQRANIENQK